jgi:hypothetical protein
MLNLQADAHSGYLRRYTGSHLGPGTRRTADMTIHAAQSDDLIAEEIKEQS